MLHVVRRRAARHEDRPVVGLLLECHERIRSFSELAERVASAHDVPPDEIAGAAEALLRYFTVALPRHEEDEEQSLAPRLRAAPGGADDAAALHAMAADHVQAHALLATLEPVWKRLAKCPQDIADAGVEFAANSSALRGLFLRHLAHEEHVLFPRIAQLTPGECAAVEAEMRARRGHDEIHADASAASRAALRTGQEST